MALDELNDQLHSRDFHADRTRRPTMFEPEGALSETASAELSRTESWRDPAAKPVTTVSGVPEKSSSKKKYWRVFSIALGAVVLMAVIVVVAVRLNASRFSEENVKLTLSGANDVSSVERVTFTVEYNNDNWVNLKNATLIFEYPESFRPDSTPDLSINQSRAEKKLGEIASHSQGKVTLSGKFFGFRGERAVLSGTLRYNPGLSSSTFEKRTQKEVRVASSPLFFEIIAPTELVSGQEVQYEIRYGNDGEVSVPNLKVKLDYPDGFTFTDADPRPVEGNTVWTVGTLAPHTDGTMTVRGRLTGGRDQQRVIHGAIGFFQGDGKFALYSEHEKRTRIVASPLAITLSVNGYEQSGSVDVGSILHYVAQYKNEGNVGIRDAILTVEMDSPYIDPSTIRFESNVRGAYNQSSKSISWKASDMAALSRVEPGQSGKVSFVVSTYPDLKTRFPDARQLAYQSVAKIDSPDIPALNGITKVVASSVFTIKFNTTVTDGLRLTYQDGTFSDSGPLPPVTGQETTYTVHYTLTNTFNNVENGRVSILFPTGIRYTGQKSPENEKMVFNERANELVWDVGTLAAGTTRELAFQVGVNPEPGSDGRDITLVSHATFTGKDAFTGQDLKLEEDKKTNTL